MDGLLPVEACPPGLRTAVECFEAQTELTTCRCSFGIGIRLQQGACINVGQLWATIECTKQVISKVATHFAVQNRRVPGITLNASFLHDLPQRMGSLGIYIYKLRLQEYGQPKKKLTQLCCCCFVIWYSKDKAAIKEIILEVTVKMRVGR